MNRSCSLNLFYTLILATALSIVFACAGSHDVPESERKIIEGVVVEGGINAFRMKSDNGKILRFEDRNDIEYDPSDFHAYYGDRVRVTYFTKLKGEKELHMALKIVLLTTNPDRIDFRSGEVEGIIRASGMWRYLVHLPKQDVTVALYKKGTVKRLPSNWYPEAGNKVKAFITEDSGLFVKKFKCYQINRLGDDLVSIDDNSETGVITEIFVHRSVKKAPDRFAFQVKNEDNWTLFAGGETELVPNDLNVLVNEIYSIQYYRLLLGDQSFRYVANRIEKARFY